MRAVNCMFLNSVISSVTVLNCHRQEITGNVTWGIFKMTRLLFLFLLCTFEDVFNKYTSVSMMIRLFLFFAFFFAIFNFLQSSCLCVAFCIVLLCLMPFCLFALCLFARSLLVLCLFAWCFSAWCLFVLYLLRDDYDSGFFWWLFWLGIFQIWLNPFQF